MIFGAAAEVGLTARKMTSPSYVPVFPGDTNSGAFVLEPGIHFETVSAQYGSCTITYLGGNYYQVGNQVVREQVGGMISAGSQSCPSMGFREIGSAADGSPIVQAFGIIPSHPYIDYGVIANAVVMAALGAVTAYAILLKRREWRSEKFLRDA